MHLEINVYFWEYEKHYKSNLLMVMQHVFILQILLYKTVVLLFFL